MAHADLAHADVLLRLLDIGSQPTGLLSGLESPNALVLEYFVNFLQSLANGFLEKEEDVNRGNDTEGSEDTVNLPRVKIFVIKNRQSDLTFH